MSLHLRIRRDNSKTRLEQENTFLRRELQASQAEITKKNNQLDQQGWEFKRLNEKIIAKEKEELKEKLDFDYLRNKLEAAEKKITKMEAAICNHVNRIRNLEHELDLATRDDLPFKFENKYEQRLERSLEHTRKEQSWNKEKHQLLVKLEVNQAQLRAAQESLRATLEQSQLLIQNFGEAVKRHGTTRDDLKKANEEINYATLQLQRAKNPITHLRCLYFLICILWPLFFILNN